MGFYSKPVNEIIKKVSTLVRKYALLPSNTSVLYISNAAAIIVKQRGTSKWHKTTQLAHPF